MLRKLLAKKNKAKAKKDDKKFADDYAATYSLPSAPTQPQEPIPYEVNRYQQPIIEQQGEPVLQQPEPIDSQLLIEGAEQGNMSLVKELVDLGADLEITHDSFLNTPLCYAAYEGHIAIVELLLKSGANKEAANRKGQTVLIQAIYKGHIEIVKLLLAAGVNIEAKNNNGETALAMAAKLGNLEIVTLLLEKGADKDTQNKDNKTPLILAKEKGHTATVRILRNFGKVTFKDRLEKINCDIENDKDFDDFRCPISKELITDPISGRSGINYDRDNLEDYFISKGNPPTLPCPLTRIPLDKAMLDYSTHLTTKNLIDRLVTAKEVAYAKLKNDQQTHKTSPELTKTKEQIDIYVSLEHSVRCKLQILPSETINNIKNHFLKQNGLSANYPCTLFFGGKQLDTELRADQYHIQSNSELSAVMKR